MQILINGLGLKQVELSYKKVEELLPNGNEIEITELVFILNFNEIDSY